MEINLQAMKDEVIGQRVKDFESLVKNYYKSILQNQKDYSKMNETQNKIIKDFETNPKEVLLKQYPSYKDLIETIQIKGLTTP